VRQTISYLEDLLANPHKILGLIKEDLQDLKESYGDERRTKIMGDATTEFNEEDLVKDEEVLISITQRGYIKRVPSQTYRSQTRGGRGVMGMTTRDEDEVEFLIAAGSLDTVLYFTDRGKVYSEKAWQIPDASRISKGVSVVNLINLAADEKVTAAVAIPDFDQAEYLIMLTRKGRIKRTNLSEFDSVRPSGLIAINLDDDDQLNWVKLTDGDSEVILVTRQGQAIRFHESDVRPMGRAAAGVGAMRMKGNDELSGMDVVDPGGDLLVVTEKGYAKRTSLSEYNLQRRNGSGVRTLAKTLAKTGAIVMGGVVTDDGDITLISKDGITLRTSIKSISRQGRSTSGVRVMSLKSGDVVASVAVLDPKSSKPKKKAVNNGAAASLPTETDLSDGRSNGHQEV
jgi:DNA gyrase subunit A